MEKDHTLLHRKVKELETRFQKFCSLSPESPTHRSLLSEIQSRIHFLKKLIHREASLYTDTTTPQHLMPITLRLLEIDKFVKNDEIGHPSLEEHQQEATIEQVEEENDTETDEEVMKEDQKFEGLEAVNHGLCEDDAEDRTCWWTNSCFNEDGEATDEEGFQGLIEDGEFLEEKVKLTEEEEDEEGKFVEGLMDENVKFAKPWVDKDGDEKTEKKIEKEKKARSGFCEKLMVLVSGICIGMVYMHFLMVTSSDYHYDSDSDSFSYLGFDAFLTPT